MKELEALNLIQKGGYDHAIKQLAQLQKSEKKLSDAYLRIRQMLGAWDTNHGGENRFEVTEAKLAQLQEAGGYLARRLARVSGGSDEEALDLWAKAVEKLMGRA